MLWALMLEAGMMWAFEVVGGAMGVVNIFILELLSISSTHAPLG